MSTPKSGGASISARARTPSLDLATVAGLLAKSVEVSASAKAASAIPLASFDAAANRLRINVRGVLGRLLSNPDFQSKLKAGADTGFARDLDFPPRGCDAKMGGRLLPGSEATTTAAVSSLHNAISKELDAALGQTDVSTLIAPSAQSALEELSHRLGRRIPVTPETASLVAIEFASPDRKAHERERDVARVLTAIEVIEGRDWLEKMISGVKRKLTNDDVPEEEIESILESIALQREQPGSQIRRFLDFLDDEALARVRLQVTFELMQSVATQSDSAGLKAYVERVQACFERFASSRGDSLLIDVSAVYGQRNNSDLAEHLRKAMFYGVLPLWADWATQLFEVRSDPAQGFATKREVSYRFRVNGQNPETSKSAFSTRLDRLEARLLEEPGPQVSGYRAFAELIFLRLVVPTSSSAPNTEDLWATANDIGARLKVDPVATVRELIGELRTRESVMDQLADELIHVLQSKSRKLVDAANRRADKYYIAVHKNIVDWNAVTSMGSPGQEILVRNERIHDNVAWFSNLTITDDPTTATGTLASYSVETTLVERCLAPVDGRAELRMARDNSAPVLAIRMIPYKLEKDPATGEVSWTPENESYRQFDFGRGLDIEYELRPLALSRKADDKASLEQMRAASCTAFALVTYIVAWDLVRRIKAREGMQDVAAYLLRLQPGGRESASTDGNAAIYSIAHALERALCRELPVKMQGFNTGGDSRTEGYRKGGTLVALQGGFPLDTRLRSASPLDRVALVSYVTRPCDMHPANPDADGFLFVSRTYRADRTEDGFKLKLDAMQSRLVDTRKAFHEPQLVLEEIARLRGAGYQNIILLSHHFGNRHIGRAAERHSPHGSFEFLEEASNKFPDVLLYPLRRDVFPATRLHKRLGTESAFEVLSHKEHLKLLEGVEKDMLRSLVPVYTFATLAVVSEDGRPQSGFCTYFLDVEQRLSNLEWAHMVRQNILGLGEGKPVRKALIGVLRALHYLESEKTAAKAQVLPVLDPFGWVAPTTNGAAGELTVMERRGKGSVLLSFPAILAHVTKVLHKEPV